MLIKINLKKENVKYSSAVDKKKREPFYDFECYALKP